MLPTTAAATATAIAAVATAATAPVIARVFGEFVWEGVLGWRRSCGRGQESEQEQTWEQERGLRVTCDCVCVCHCDWDCLYGCDCACDRQSVRGVRVGGKLGWRRSCGRGRDSEQEHTWEQERGLRGTCACGRVCNCDLGCHYGCDCACNRSCVRSTDDPRILLAGSSGTWRSIAVRGLACPGIRSSAGICAWPPLGLRGRRSRGQHVQQERTREQTRGTGGCGDHL